MLGAYLPQRVLTAGSVAAQLTAAATAAAMAGAATGAPGVATVSVSVLLRVAQVGLVIGAALSCRRMLDDVADWMDPRRHSKRRSSRRPASVGVRGAAKRGGRQARAQDAGSAAAAAAAAVADSEGSGATTQQQQQRRAALREELVALRQEVLDARGRPKNE